MRCFCTATVSLVRQCACSSLWISLRRLRRLPELRFEFCGVVFVLLLHVQLFRELGDLDPKSFGFRFNLGAGGLVLLLHR